MSTTLEPEESLISGALGTVAPPRTLNTWKLGALIVGNLTPLACVVATVPIGLAYGGPTTAYMFLAAGIVYAFFCVGYAAMTQRITRPGAFYSYIARGLGRPAGVGAALMASVIYPIGLIGAWAVGAYTITQMLGVVGIQIHWAWVFLFLVVVIGALVWRRIDVSAVIGAVVVAVEIVLVLVLIIGVVATVGFNPQVVSVDAFQYGDWTVAFIFCILVFQGFEGGALYGPEAKRPRKTVPRALFLALTSTVVVLFFASWALGSVVPIGELQATVVEQGLVGYVLTVVATTLGPTGLVIFAIGAALATFVVTLGATNFMARYINGLAKDDLLPHYLASTNKHGAPVGAVYTLIGIVTIVNLICLIAGVDPYLQVTPVAFAVGAFGSIALLTVTSIAVVGYFARTPRDRPNPFVAYVAPVIGAVLLVISASIVLAGFSWVTGSQEPWLGLLPWGIVLVFVVGVGFGFWLRKNRPSVYADIAQGDTGEEALELRRNRIAERIETAAQRTQRDAR